MFSLKRNSENDSFQDVENILDIKKKKVNPAIKVGSTVLYIVLIASLVCCAVMVGVDYFTEPQQYVIVNNGQFDPNADLSAYPESLQKLYKTNFEAMGFAYSYFDYKDKQPDINLDEYKDSKKVPLFMQWDVRWGYKNYGGDFAAITADAPVCLSMVGFYLTEDEETFSPEKVMAFADAGNYYKQGSGTKTAFMTKGAEKLGLKVGEITPEYNNIVAALQDRNGKCSPIICLMKAGKFSSGYHYIVLKGLDEQGNILINDPNSLINSNKAWKFEEFSKEINKLWCYALA